MCVSWRVEARPARLVHSLRLRAKVLLVDVGRGRRGRRDGRLHDLGGIGDLGAAHELGFLCGELEGMQARWRACEPWLGVCGIICAGHVRMGRARCVK